MLHNPCPGLGKMQQNIDLVVIPTAVDLQHCRDLPYGEGTKTGLGIPDSQTGAAVKHKTGQLAAETAAKLHILIHTATAKDQRPIVTLGNVANGNGILKRVLSVCVYSNHNRIGSKVILNVVKSCF